MKNVGRMLALMMVLGLAVPAHAAYIGTLEQGYYSTQSWNSPGRFADRWEFQVAQDSLVSLRLTDLERNLEVFGFSVALLDNRNLSGLLDGASFSPGACFSATLRAGVDYTLRVSGRAAGLLGGKYLLEGNVAPVPLPAALPMLLLALGGLVGIKKLSRRSDPCVA